MCFEFFLHKVHVSDLIHNVYSFKNTRHNQCVGSGSSLIRNFSLEPDPDQALGKFEAGSGTGINRFGSNTLDIIQLMIQNYNNCQIFNNRKPKK